MRNCKKKTSAWTVGNSQQKQQRPDLNSQRDAETSGESAVNFRPVMSGHLEATLLRLWQGGGAELRLGQARLDILEQEAASLALLLPWASRWSRRSTDPRMEEFSRLRHASRLLQLKQSLVLGEDIDPGQFCRCFNPTSCWKFILFLFAGGDLPKLPALAGAPRQDVVRKEFQLTRVQSRASLLQRG